MKILAFMQNQWLRNAAMHEERLAHLKAKDYWRYRQVRRRMIAYALFAGCRSGQVLKSVLGELLCNQIVWEEASPKIGDNPNSIYPADLKHMAEVISEESPDLIIGFGKIAGGAVPSVCTATAHYLLLPHPACRHPDDHAKLKSAREQIEAIRKGRKEVAGLLNKMRKLPTSIKSKI